MEDIKISLFYLIGLGSLIGASLLFANQGEPPEISPLPTVVPPSKVAQVATWSTVVELESPAEVAGNPSRASITNEGMSCSIPFGHNLGGADNFGLVVYSEAVGDTLVIGRMAIQWGQARSITTENGEIVESALYDYVVLAMDNSALGEEDTWSMTLWGQAQMFDGVTFSGPVMGGDLSVQP